jgi:protein TonB
MSTYAHPEPSSQKIGGGFVGAVLLHIAVAAAILGAALLHPFRSKPWGEDAAATGSVQASIVDAIPLPPKAPTVDHSVLTSENVTKAPAPPVKEMTAPPPTKTDVLIKKDTKVVPKIAPKETTTPTKHPQPTPDSPKATSGDPATQLPQSITQATNGTATVTVQNRTFGNRYAYYLRLVGSMVTKNYNEQHPDPRASQDKSVTLLFDIQRDGTVANLRFETKSGSPSLDTAGQRAIQEVDSFPQLPEGDHISIEYKFDYHHP